MIEDMDKAFDDCAENSELKHVIYLSLGGSYCYGLNHENSDLDIRGVAVRNREEILGLFWQRENGIEKLGYEDKDYVIWYMDRFFQLLMKGDANTFESIYSPHKKIYHPEIAKLLLTDDIKQAAYSKKIIKAYCGFASAQMKRMNRMNKDTEIGSKRYQRIEAHGYDTKEAMHALRCIKVSKRTLDTGKFSVDCREWKEELFNVRDGHTTYDEMLKTGTELLAEIDKMIEDKVCGMPDIPDMGFINEVAIKIHEIIVSEKNDG
jgi:predicted nucleotidyltransferase